MVNSFYPSYWNTELEIFTDNRYSHILSNSFDDYLCPLSVHGGSSNTYPQNEFVRVLLFKAGNWVQVISLY